MAGSGSNRTRMVLIFIILATIPCYILGIGLWLFSPTDNIPDRTATARISPTWTPIDPDDVITNTPATADPLITPTWTPIDPGNLPTWTPFTPAPVVTNTSVLPPTVFVPSPTWTNPAPPTSTIAPPTITPTPTNTQPILVPPTDTPAF